MHHTCVLFLKIGAVHFSNLDVTKSMILVWNCEFFATTKSTHEVAKLIRKHHPTILLVIFYSYLVHMSSWMQIWDMNSFKSTELKNKLSRHRNMPFEHSIISDKINYVFNFQCVCIYIWLEKYVINFKILQCRYIMYVRNS